MTCSVSWMVQSFALRSPLIHPCCSCSSMTLPGVGADDTVIAPLRTLNPPLSKSCTPCHSQEPQSSPTRVLYPLPLSGPSILPYPSLVSPAPLRTLNPPLSKSCTPCHSQEPQSSPTRVLYPLPLSGPSILPYPSLVPPATLRSLNPPLPECCTHCSSLVPTEHLPHTF